MKKRRATDRPASEASLTGKNLNRRHFLGAAGGAWLAAEIVRARNSNDKKMTETQTKTDLDFLEKYPTTLLESAVSLIMGTHDGIVVTRPGLVRRTANQKRLVGYAVTCEFSTDADDERGRKDNADYWNYVFRQGNQPKIAVAVDASGEPGSGSSWGQLNGHIHRALGCRGVLTNGGVRDINVFDELGFQVFSGSLTVGHGNPHFVKYGEPVTLYGAKIKSEDVIVADEHGAIVIPKEVLPHVEEAVAEIQRRVKIVADYCRQPDFSVAGLIEAQRKMKPAGVWKPSKSKIQG